MIWLWVKTRIPSWTYPKGQVAGWTRAPGLHPCPYIYIYNNYTVLFLNRQVWPYQFIASIQARRRPMSRRLYRINADVPSRSGRGISSSCPNLEKEYSSLVLPKVLWHPTFCCKFSKASKKSTMPLRGCGAGSLTGQIRERRLRVYLHYCLGALLQAKNACCILLPIVHLSPSGTGLAKNGCEPEQGPVSKRIVGLSE